jgi:uncharacterized repeat protein (TIGR03847 family)
MSGQQFEFGSVDKITVGVIGQPGEREFFLQASLDRQVVTLKIEKQQVRMLCDELTKIIQERPRPGHVESEDAANMALSFPLDVDFVCAGIGIGVNPENDDITIVCEELVSADEPQGHAAFVLTLEQAVALTIHGTGLVEAGRPSCPLCSYPLDPRGHICPRTNGNSAPLL